MAIVAPNLTLQSVILVKPHTDAITDTDPVPTPAAHAMLCHTEVNPVQPNFERVTPAYLTGSFTPQADILGRSVWDINPQVYLQCAAAEDVPPFWYDMLIACGHKGTHTTAVDPAPNIWVVAPVTEGAIPVAIYHHRGGTLKKMLMCLGNCRLDFPAGQPVNMTFAMKGLYTVPTDVAYPSSTLVIPTPLARTVQSEGLTIGAYTPRFTNITFDPGCQVAERRDGNSAEAMYGIYIRGRQPSCVITLEATVAFATGFNPYANKGLFVDLNWVHPTAVGGSFEVDVPDAQLVGVAEREVDGRLMFECTFKPRSNTPDTEYSYTITEPNPGP